MAARGDGLNRKSSASGWEVRTRQDAKHGPLDPDEPIPEIRVPDEAPEMQGWITRGQWCQRVLEGAIAAPDQVDQRMAAMHSCTNYIFV